MKVTIVAGMQCTGKTTLINQLIYDEAIRQPIIKDRFEFDEDTFKQSVFEMLEDVDSPEHVFIESQDDFVLGSFDDNEKEFYDTTLRLFRTWVDPFGKFRHTEIGLLPF